MTNANRVAECGQGGIQHARQVRRLQDIATYFDADAVRRLLLPVATATFDISLRLLDYCCTNYAKKTRVVICQKGVTLHLFSLYKDWLRHYRRRAFDPFRRRERICFEHPDKEGAWLDTTVAQLNFLRWAEIYGVLGYVRQNLSVIELDMMRTLSASKKRRLEDQEQTASASQPQKRRRVELSRAPSGKCTVYILPRSVLFPTRQ